MDDTHIPLGRMHHVIGEVTPHERYVLDQAPTFEAAAVLLVRYLDCDLYARVYVEREQRPLPSKFAKKSRKLSGCVARRRLTATEDG